MKAIDLIRISLTLVLMLIALAMIPKSCSKELANQDAMNAQYALEFSGSSSLNPNKGGFS